MYVMKTVARDMAGSSWKDIETEMQVLSLANPYKLHLDCFFVSGNTLFMVIDYCGNGDLLKAMADKVKDHELFEEDEIWKYFIQICFGLESLHYNGFIHQDLHPQNILLDENKDIKIANFGISSSSQTKTAQGDFSYQSPRTHSGDTQAKESNIWAVGCILYYLCSLDYPFGDNVNKKKDEPRKPIRDEYSNELRDFIDWCLKKKRKQRPTILDILTHEFIVHKTLSLGIPIPQTSAMNASTCRIELSEERERSAQLEKKLSKYKKKNRAKNNEIESLKKEIDSLNRIINEKGFEGVKEPTESEVSLPNSQISIAINDLNRKLEDIDTLRNKVAEILSKPNNPELEMDFRATCSAYQSNNSYDPPFMQAYYQDYLNAYQQSSSLYNLKIGSDNKVNLYIYNTETETKEVKILQTLEPLGWRTCITQLPNGKLFCFGKDLPVSGLTMLVDFNGGVEVLPSGTPCCDSSSIYFNSSVYCFGGYDGKHLALSSRFDLNQNRWIELKKMPKADFRCNSIIFNWNILISGEKNRNLLRYSIDSNSFTTIPYKFTADMRKILINAERLYLIECDVGSIYESEIGSDTNWRRIAESSIKDYPAQMYLSYNKGGIYIGYIKIQPLWGIVVEYWKFDLNKTLLSKLV